MTYKTIKFYISSILLIACHITYSQKCAILDMTHFGGNGSDNIDPPGVITHPDNSFSFTIYSNSTTGNIPITCTSTTGGFSFFQTYDINYIANQSRKCAKKGNGFKWESFYMYPQSNGDTILIGMLGDDFTPTNIGIERRDASGNLIWEKSYGGTGDDGLVTVREAADGGFYILTGTNSSDGDVGLHYGSEFAPDIWVLRIDNNGNKLWGTQIGGTSTDIASDIIINPDGSAVLFGVTTSNDYDCTGLKGGSDLYIVKLDSSGNKLWHHCLGGSGFDGSGTEYGVWAKTDGHGGYFVLNRTDSHDGDVQHKIPDGIDFWLLHLDSASNIIWENTYGGSFDQYPTAICQATDGTLWMGGWFSGLTTASGLIDTTYGRDDSWVVHVDTLGNFINQRVLGNDNDDYVKTLHPLPDGTVLAAGQYGFTNNPAKSSPNFPSTTEGFSDVFIAHLGPNSVKVNDISFPSSNWEISPNPAGNTLQVQITDHLAIKYHYKIVNDSGKEVSTGTFNKQTLIDTKLLSPGIYIVTLTDNKGYSSSKKVIIKH